MNDDEFTLSGTRYRVLSSALVTGWWRRDDGEEVAVRYVAEFVEEVK